MQLFRLALAALMLLGSTAIQAQGTAWPGKPIRWIVPYPPGGITDNATRMVLQKVNEQTGWTIVVENKPGANSILGADLAAKAAPDGYTFLTVIAAHAANATLYAGKLPFDPVKSCAPMSLVGIAPLIMTANNDLPAKDVKELIAYAKANPGKISFGSSGVGAAARLTTGCSASAGVDMVHVPYKGTAPALRT
jgi:tripartite-type tricarboxylate transporter receptor subunit TctC